MIRPLRLLAAILVLGACAMQEEVILEEPMMEEEVVRASPAEDCELGGEDGIGGTGCEPVAQSLSGAGRF